MKVLIRSLLCLLTVGVPMALAAQSEAQIKEINKIKLDPQYIFAESTMGSADDARETVCLTLTNFMNEYLEENGEARRVAAAELGAIKYINGKRGSNYYVFGYLPVATFASTTATTVTTEPEPEPEPEIAVAFSADNSDSQDKKAESIEQMVKEPELEAVAAAVAAAVAPTERSATAADAGSDMIAELLDAGAASKAVYLLNVFKSVGKVRGYGDISSCRDAAGAYWLIAGEQGNIEALLGPSATDDRYDYVSGETRHLASYGGKYAIWFTPRSR